MYEVKRHGLLPLHIFLETQIGGNGYGTSDTTVINSSEAPSTAV
jgi:hypothetical protein